MRDTIAKVKDTMKERNYWLYATTGDDTVLHYGTPIEEKPHFACEVYVYDKDKVDFKFRYITKRATILTTERIGSFFDEEHFSKFETDFWNLATVLYNYEKE